jgi:hypothetical protein
LKTNENPAQSGTFSSGNRVDHRYVGHEFHQRGAMVGERLGRQLINLG